MPGSFNPPTIQGAIQRQTENYNFLIPVFDAPGWGTSMARNFDVIDSVLFAVTGIGNVQGAWENSTVYSVAARVVDTVDNSLWQNYVEHTSAASGSFADDRAAHPTYWRTVTNGSVPRGDWVTDTVYNAGEIVTDGGRTGVVAQLFTSSTSYDDDVTDGNIVTIVDTSAFTSFDVAIVAADNKVTLANADLFGVVDSADSNELKNHTWANVKAGIKTYADTLYQPLSSVLTNTTASFLTTDEAKLDAIEALADVTDAVNVGTSIAGTADKATLVDADRFALIDSAAGNVVKAPLLSRIRTWLQEWLVPTGTIHAFAYDDESAYYLDCDGASYLRTGIYAALFAKIGTTYGAADGTHFNVPNLEGEFLRGWDDGRGVDSGRALGSAQTDLVKAHTHGLTMDAIAPHTHTYGPKTGVYGANSDPYGSTDFRPSVGDSSGSSTTLTTSSNGGTTPTGTISANVGAENRPRNVAVKFRIKL